MTAPLDCPAPALDPNAAATFLAALTGQPDGWSTPVTFQTFSDGGDGAKDPSLARIFHGPLAGCLDALTALNNAGAGVFVVVNATDLRGRSAANVVGIRALYVDSDAGTLPPKLALDPHIRVRTVQGEHVYWLLRPDEPRDDFGPSQKALIAFYGTDKSIHDLPRVMRLPGFLHRKGIPTALEAWYGPVPPLAERYTIDDVLRAHPKLRLLQPNSPFAAVAGDGDAMARLRPQRSKRDKFDEACASLAVARKDRNVHLFRAARLGRDLLQIGAANELDIRTRLIEAATANGLIAEEQEKTLATIGRGLAEDTSWEARVLSDADGHPKPVVGNAIMILSGDEEWSKILALNTRSQEITFVSEPPFPMTERLGELPRPLVDADYGKMAAWFTGYRKMPINDRIAAVGALTAASQTLYDPVVDYLNAIQWDGCPRLETALVRYAGASVATQPEAYLRAVFKRWTIGAVARAMSPGCQMDTTLILEGDTGSGKTSFFRILGSVADRAFGENPPRDISSQAMKEFIRSLWLVEFGELSTFTKSEIEAIKAFLTTLSDRYRPAYGRTLMDFPRLCVFCGTTNGTVYFQDATGNRRFLPVATGEIDLPALAADRDQLWAEAVALYDAGEPWDLTAEEKAMAEIEQDKRFECDALEPAIRTALTTGVRADAFSIGPTLVGGGLQQWAIAPMAASVSVREILEHVCKDRGERPRALQGRISTILSSRLKWTARFDGTGERRYYRPVTSAGS